MINTENLERVYEKTVKGEELTTKELNEIGLNSKDLKELVESGKLIRVKRGLYELADANDLLSYGKKLIAEKKHELATICFEKGYELDPTNRSFCFQLFLRSIQSSDYERAFELFEQLSGSNNKFYEQDLNFYLYLLSAITDVPEKYQDYTKYIAFDSVRVSTEDRRYPDALAQNRIRTAALNKRFPTALKQLNDQIEKKGSKSLQDLIIENLLIKAINKTNKNKNTLITLLKEKKYDEAIEFLEKKNDTNGLSTMEVYELKLLHLYLETKKRQKAPRVTIPKEENLFEAINTGNFAMALRLNQEFNEQRNIISENNPMYILLTDMCELVASLSKAAPVEENAPKVKEEPKKTISFASILNNLLSNNIKEAIADLKEYLASFGKEKYETLIIDLIELDLTERDTAFSNAMTAVSLLSKGSFELDSSIYLQEFYISLYSKNLEKARICLNIIKDANNLGYSYIETSALEETYAKTKGIETPKEEVVQRIEEDIEPIMEETPKVKEEKVSSPVITSQKINDVKEYSEPTDAEIRKFVEKKRKALLNNGGIVLFTAENGANLDKYLDVIRTYPDLDGIIINSDGKDRLIIRHVEYSEENADFKHIYDEGTKAYNEERYFDCLDSLLYLLQVQPNPKASVFAKIGLAYMKTFNNEQAIKYLTIATILSKAEGSTLDYTDLISKLKDRKPRKNSKKEVKDQKTLDLDYFFGIDNFFEINDFVKETGLGVEGACANLSLTEEQVALVKLIYAREYYISGYYDNGDKFLLSVEKTPNKTQAVKDIAAEIRRNKMFYKNRESNIERPELQIFRPR